MITLVALAIAALARVTARSAAARATWRRSATPRPSVPHVPAVTETATRLPVGAPLVASADSPALKAVYLVLLVVFLVGAVLQSLRLRNDYSFQIR